MQRTTFKEVTTCFDCGAEVEGTAYIAYCPLCTKRYEEVLIRRMFKNSKGLLNLKDTREDAG